MSFFNSEIVREELETINELQSEIFEELSSFPNLTTQQKNEHIEKMTSLLEKQQLMYTRVSLSDDPQAIRMKEELQKCKNCGNAKIPEVQKFWKCINSGSSKIPKVPLDPFGSLWISFDLFGSH